MDDTAGILQLRQHQIADQAFLALASAPPFLEVEGIYGRVGGCRNPDVGAVVALLRPVAGERGGAGDPEEWAVGCTRQRLGASEGPAGERRGGIRRCGLSGWLAEESGQSRLAVWNAGLEHRVGSPRYGKQIRERQPAPARDHQDGQCG